MSDSRTMRSFEHDGLTVSEVEFWIDEQGWALGYMVGPDDGKTSLYVTPQQAVDAVRAATHEVKP